ncbi:beta 1-4 rhamnosyltransferase Cps2T [Clostridium prolinivorans]|uniref:beta 1-4 rhamnosyltransferase Cps2T n=1 Tax=Clostridium prolinivorans TaxID=2769420 RepID=UPI000FDCBE68|nr:DUF1972 domain-containing protein [Clostridium prolinivorans]
MKNVFIIGSKGIPAKYGGFETFVDKLTEKKVSDEIKYHVSCMSHDTSDEFEYNNARCFNVKIKDVGNANAIIYDIQALRMCKKYIEENNLKNCIIYVLACRIGPFLLFYKKQLQKLGIKVFVNPDGHEWKRSKWNYFIRQYWKISERLMIKKADLVVCDSIGIESYIKEEYKKYNPKTIFIAYGADVKENRETNIEKLNAWYNKFNLKNNEYYLIVGRFVPENNYELMIREFMASSSKKDLVIITNVEQNKFYEKLQATTNFKDDNRIKFVGTVYDQELLTNIRENAYGYLHGHEVGGTNPSLLEALATTKLNLLLNVVFNEEVGKDGALYFNKDKGNLAEVIDKADRLTEEEINQLGKKAKNRIVNEYSWESIVEKYEKLFIVD